MQLKIGTKNYDRFTRVPIPLTIKIYFFNISNSDKVLEGSERPHFEEVGPFMFKQWRRRDVIDFLDYNRRVRYREYKTFYPIYPPPKQQQQQLARHNISSIDNSNSESLQTLANGTKTTTTTTSDSHTHQTSSASSSSSNNMYNSVPLDPRDVNITVINVPLLAALTQLAKLEDGSVKRKLASKIAGRLIADKRDKILMSRPANELLFDGTRVNFMDSAKDLISDVLGFNFESPLPNNKFGFFYLKNNTWSRRENGELTVYTGRNDSMSDFMLIENWNDLKQLQVWPSNTVAGNRCNEIRGSDGSQFHPNVKRDQVLDLFSPLVCTSLHLVYKEDTQARDIPLLRFITPSELFAAPRKNPKNACYCTVTNNNNNGPSSRPTKSAATINDSRCYLDGLMDLSLCQRGAPIAASSPHFYNADPMLAMAAGLKPNKDIHQTYLDIEPMTGAVMRAASRAQINAYVEQSALDVIDSSIVGHMTPMVAPLFWIEEAAEIDEKTSGEFKEKLLSLVQKAHRSFIISIALGILVALLVSLQYWYVTCYAIDTDELRRRRRQQRQRKQQRQKANNNRPRSPTKVRLGGGARHSNRANMEKPVSMLLGAQFDDDGFGEEEEEDGEENGGAQASSSCSSASDTAKAALPVVVAAAALGAASAGPSSTRRKQAAAARAAERRPRSAGRQQEQQQPPAGQASPAATTTTLTTAAGAPTSSSTGVARPPIGDAQDNRACDGDGDGEDELSSRKMLVDHE